MHYVYDDIESMPGSLICLHKNLVIHLLGEVFLVDTIKLQQLIRSGSYLVKRNISEAY